MSSLQPGAAGGSGFNLTADAGFGLDRLRLGSLTGAAQGFGSVASSFVLVRILCPLRWIDDDDCEQEVSFFLRDGNWKHELELEA